MLLVIILLATTHARIFHKPREFRCQSLVVFGDSLSDDGVEATGESHGFTRNSNGKIWPEYVERMLQCDEYINYAYSGAKSGQDNFYFEGWSGVGWQEQETEKQWSNGKNDGKLTFEHSFELDRN
ncbi:unnamed protein product [Haemonchus placei]|uniref:SGNH_hydro domain-containing protein n=1 Tax=Haemonchus placei TaxID=6290 RepID=A0A0N4W4E7_HAEPC|nr:unnamed protein product [Haemonchus placei]